MQTGDFTSVRRLFAFSQVSERNGDVTPATVLPYPKECKNMV
jgi:hypothetical protein